MSSYSPSLFSECSEHNYEVGVLIGKPILVLGTTHLLNIATNILYRFILLFLVFHSAHVRAPLNSTQICGNFYFRWYFFWYFTAVFDHRYSMIYMSSLLQMRCASCANLTKMEEHTSQITTQYPSRVFGCQVHLFCIVTFNLP